MDPCCARYARWNQREKALYPRLVSKMVTVYFTVGNLGCSGLWNCSSFFSMVKTELTEALSPVFAATKGSSFTGLGLILLSKESGTSRRTGNILHSCNPDKAAVCCGTKVVIKARSSITSQ